MRALLTAPLPGADGTRRWLQEGEPLPPSGMVALLDALAQGGWREADDARRSAEASSREPL